MGAEVAYADESAAWAETATPQQPPKEFGQADEQRLVRPRNALWTSHRNGANTLDNKMLPPMPWSETPCVGIRTGQMALTNGCVQFALAGFGCQMQS